MMQCYRLLTLLLLLSGLTACVSTEELYARYDSQMCPAAQTVVKGMTWHNAIFFPYNGSVVTASAEQKLNDNLRLLKQHPDYRVILRGFADSVASQQYNLPLSRKRAQAVADWMSANGVKPERIDQVGLGKKLLLIPAVKGQDQQANRRVELLLVDGDGRPVPLEQSIVAPSEAVVAGEPL